MTTRTTARGTAMTGIGYSAPTLTTATVERPLLYDVVMPDIADPELAVRPADERGLNHAAGRLPKS